jgi:serine/threonine-protein kinase
MAAFVAQPALAEDHFGAIAFSNSSGALGWAYDNGSRGGAEEQALQQCGPGCEIAIWFKNACGAIATTPDHAYGTGWASERGEAEEIAIGECHKHGGNCSVAKWVCTTR